MIDPRDWLDRLRSGAEDPGYRGPGLLPAFSLGNFADGPVLIVQPGALNQEQVCQLPVHSDTGRGVWRA